jgi:hypothetical protein
MRDKVRSIAKQLMDLVGDDEDVTGALHPEVDSSGQDEQKYTDEGETPLPGEKSGAYDDGDGSDPENSADATDDNGNVKKKRSMSAISAILAAKVKK